MSPLQQTASCSPGTTSPTSATFRATSCAAMGGASRAPGSVTGCPTASTRAMRRSAVSARPCWGRAQGGGPQGGGRRSRSGYTLGIRLAVLPHAVALPQKSVVWAAWSVRWNHSSGHRGPLRQALPTPTLGPVIAFILRMRNLRLRSYVASVSINQQTALLDLNSGLPDPKAQADNHLARCIHRGVFLTIK